LTNKSSNLVDVHIKNLRKKLGSACRMQLSEAMNNAQVETIFKNPLELIAEALKK